MDDKYLSYDDDSLILMIRSGNREQASELITRYLPLIRHKASSYRLPGMEPDDIVQEGLLGLIKAIDLYDSTRSSFSTFASICISSSLATAAKYALSRKSLPLRNYTPLCEEDINDKDPSFAIDPEQQLDARDRAEQLNRKIDTLLSLFEQQALKLYLSGHSYTEISCSLQTTPKAVDNALQRVRRKLRTS